MWYVAFGMAAATVATLLSFSRRKESIKQARAEDSPPKALQITWALLSFGPLAYPFFAVVAPGAAYGTILTLSFTFDTAIQIAGLGLWAAGGVLILWADRALGRFMTIKIIVASDHELITAGPYARIRHPIYAGVIFLTAGTALVFLNVVLAAWTIPVLVVANYRARKEERLLSSPEGFGAQYRAYMARTGRFLPSMRRASP
jgi:protein-S-isoprenylcysteine O-methyltransferase Ste14